MFVLQKLSVLKFCNPIENTNQLTKENITKETQHY